MKISALNMLFNTVFVSFGTSANQLHINKTNNKKKEKKQETV